MKKRDRFPGPKSAMREFGETLLTGDHLVRISFPCRVIRSV